MGNVQYLCQKQSASCEIFLRQELNLYKWRSNSNCNTFIAKTSFKNAYYHEQQEKFAHFIQKQNDNQYLEIFKFQQGQQKEERKTNEEIIIFQKYSCTLKELQKKLYIEEALYVLHSLLFGFEQIKKSYNTVVVETKCCFVTTEGEVRAWINPNCKSNKLWNPTNDNTIISHTKTRDILLKIIQITQNLALRHIKMDELLCILRTNIYKPSLKYYSFINVRKIINQFCYINNITMSNSLVNALKRNINQQKVHPVKVYNSYCKTMPSELIERPLQKNIFKLSTTQSQFKFDPLLTRSKSFGAQTMTVHTEKNHDQINQSKILSYNNLYVKSPNINLINHQNITKNSKCNFNSNIIHYSHNYVGSHFNSNKISRNPSINKEKIQQNPIKLSTYKQNFIISNKTIIENGNESNNYINVRSIQKHSNQLSPQISFKSGLRQENIKLPNHFKIYTGNVPPLKKQSQNDIKISIINNMPKNNTNQISHNYNESHSQSYEGNEAMASQRAWITTRTITKLISSNNNQQLNKSFGQSDQYYNDSEYSGALTHMGRSIVKRDSKKTRTVRISRQY